MAFPRVLVTVNVTGGSKGLRSAVDRMVDHEQRGADWLRGALRDARPNPLIITGLRVPFELNDTLTVFDANGRLIEGIRLTYAFYDAENDSLIVDVTIDDESPFDNLFPEIGADMVGPDDIGYLVIPMPDKSEVIDGTITLEAIALQPYGSDGRTTPGILLSPEERAKILEEAF